MLLDRVPKALKPTCGFLLTFLPMVATLSSDAIVRQTSYTNIQLVRHCFLVASLPCNDKDRWLTF